MNGLVLLWERKEVFNVHLVEFKIQGCNQCLIRIEENLTTGDKVHNPLPLLGWIPLQPSELCIGRLTRQPCAEFWEPTCSQRSCAGKSTKSQTLFFLSESISPCKAPIHSLASEDSASATVLGSVTPSCAARIIPPCFTSPSYTTTYLLAALVKLIYYRLLAAFVKLIEIQCKTKCVLYYRFY